ncbi:MAG: tat (twin-arginine translocation) pathway signal sequence domain protein [Betaproteobacteria bacterium]|nr:tat (twin-arginine translocation) pathway signal sequence domain protein [Betaproteobacteria bacterium]
MNRRSLLKTLAIAPLAAQLGGHAGRLFAAPAGTPRCLVVFLRGGYDAASLLVPVSSSFYYQSRPNIAIPRPSEDLRSAIALDADWGLHPVLRESIYPLYKNGQVAFMPFAGTEDLTRSHFETQDSIELGQPLTGTRNFRSGFMNRLAGVLNNASPIALTDQLPLSMQGDVQVPNIALRSVGKPNVDQRQSKIIASMYGNTALASQVNEGFAVRDDVAKQFAGEMEAASRNAITAKGFELEARRIARLMKDKYTLGFVDVGGWDTHVGQGAAAGYLAGRLDELGRGLAGFADEMGPEAWRDTVVVVVSEFGRTFRENGNRGTDHGHGSVYWIMGGGIKGGRVVGEQQRIEQATLFQNRDYPVLNEYRAVLGGLFGRMYGMKGDQVEKVFAQARPRDVGLV